MAPLPAVIVSCGTKEKPNVMTAAWTGIINSNPPMTYVSVRKERYSHKLIEEKAEFVINLTTLELAEATDYVGVRSGAKEDKIAKMGLKMIASTEVSCPQIEQSPVSLECRVVEVKSYPTHDMFIAEIVAVDVDDKYMDSKGKLDLEKAGMLVYSHGEYFTMGRKVGGFGWSVNEKLKAKEARKKEKFVAAEERKESKEFKPKREFSERKPREGERRSFERKPRGDGEERPARKSFDGKPKRDFGDRKPRQDGEGRPPRKFDDKPARKNFDDKPRRDFGDRPKVEKVSHKKFRNK